jgi:hypothetical protein
VRTTKSKSHTMTRRERQRAVVAERIARCEAAGCKIVRPVEFTPPAF